MKQAEPTYCIEALRCLKCTLVICDTCGIETGTCLFLGIDYSFRSQCMFCRCKDVARRCWQLQREEPTLRGEPQVSRHVVQHVEQVATEWMRIVENAHPKACRSTPYDGCKLLKPFSRWRLLESELTNSCYSLYVSGAHHE